MFFSTSCKICKIIRIFLFSVFLLILLALIQKDKLHYLIYTGDADINQVASKLEELQRWKRPHEIYHVTDKLYYSGTKVQRRKLPGIVKSSDTGIISHMNFKDHNLI